MERAGVGPARILTVDDDESIRASLGLLLKEAGHRVIGEATPTLALERIRGGDVDLVLQDMNFSRQTTGEEGLELLRAIRRERPALPVILITAWGSIELAVAGMRAGAADFITKPWGQEQVLAAVRTALGLVASGGPGEVVPTRAELERRHDLEGIVGEAPTFLAAIEMLGRVAATDASILLTGESGTGKEVMADLVHRLSARRDGPLVKVNLGGIPASLFESEMFGHVRGAFTDAREDRAGRFAAARGGTLFLDELGELDPICQVKLLRVLQDRSYEPLGSSRSEKADVRVISATNRDLAAAIRAGRFREDLYYRLNLIEVRMPGLAERRADIAALAGQFLGRAAAAWERAPLYLAPDAIAWLEARPWPGNVRELKHLVERATLLAPGPLLSASDLGRAASDPEPAEPGLAAASAGMTIDEMEKAMIQQSLVRHGGNLSRVAEALGLSRPALYRRLQKHGIEP